jgi:hypothetical protein
MQKIRLIILLVFCLNYLDSRCDTIPKQKEYDILMERIHNLETQNKLLEEKLSYQQKDIVDIKEKQEKYFLVSISIFLSAILGFVTLLLWDRRTNNKQVTDEFKRFKDEFKSEKSQIFYKPLK